MKLYYIVYQIVNSINNWIYIGIHVTKNPKDRYMGSGTQIRKAIKQYGFENFNKSILYVFNNEQDMLDKERELVNEEFIARPDTYNVILGGGHFLTTGTVTVRDKDDNCFNVHKTDPRYLSGELVGATKGFVNVKDKNSNTFSVSINDPRYLSGELVAANKDMIMVKNNLEKYLFVSINDPRYLSGELIAIWKNRKHTKITKNKMSEKAKLRIGNKNSSYGSCWINNLTLKENKKIKKEDLDKYLILGWSKGRKQKWND